MKYLLLAIIFVTSFSYSAVPSHQGHHVIVEKSGNIRLGGYSSTESMLNARHFVADNKDTAKWFNRNMSNMPAKTYAGAVSNSNLPAFIEHQVSKKAVLQNMFGKVSKFAKNPLVGRAGWLGLAASFAIPYIIDEFVLDEEKGEFVSIQGFHYVLVKSDKYLSDAGYGQFLSTEALYKKCETLGHSCSIVAKASTPVAARESYCKGRTWEIVVNAATGQKHTITSDGTVKTGSCTAFGASSSDPSSRFVMIARISETRAMTYNDFERLTLPAADASPSEWVNYSRDSQDSPPPSFAYVGVTATPNASVNTDPYTDPTDGKAKQSNITINPDGKSATIKDTLRPDLQGDTETAPVPKPLPENDTETDTETKPETSSASTPLQCDSDKYPNSLGCVDTTEEIKDASMVIPQETVPLDFQVTNYITSSTGTCPQGSQFTLNFFGSNTYEFSFEPVCKFAEMIKYALWVCSWLLAYFIIIGRPE